MTEGEKDESRWYPVWCLDGEGWRPLTVCSSPLQATCQAVGGGQRVCTCPPHFGGDGFSCYGDIFQVRGAQICSLPLSVPSSHVPMEKGMIGDLNLFLGL